MTRKQNRQSLLYISKKKILNFSNPKKMRERELSRFALIFRRAIFFSISVECELTGKTSFFFFYSACMCEFRYLVVVSFS